MARLVWRLGDHRRQALEARERFRRPAGKVGLIPKPDIDVSGARLRMSAGSAS